MLETGTVSSATSLEKYLAAEHVSDPITSTAYQNAQEQIHQVAKNLKKSTKTGRVRGAFI